MPDLQPDRWTTDTGDPARIFAQMFPAVPPRPDWRLFCHPDDFRTVWLPRRMGVLA